MPIDLRLHGRRLPNHVIDVDALRTATNIHHSTFGKLVRNGEIPTVEVAGRRFAPLHARPVQELLEGRSIADITQRASRLVRTHGGVEVRPLAQPGRDGARVLAGFLRRSASPTGRMAGFGIGLGASILASQVVGSIARGENGTINAGVIHAGTLAAGIGGAAAFIGARRSGMLRMISPAAGFATGAVLAFATGIAVTGGDAR